MKYNYIIVLILVFLFDFLSAQPGPIVYSDTLNTFDSLGKKAGYWIEYIDKDLQYVKKDKASFWKYVYYHENKRTDFVWYFSAKKFRLEIEGNQLMKDSIVLMDGTYRLYDKKNRLIFEDFYKKGMLLYEKKIDINDSRVYSLNDFRKKYSGLKESFYTEVYEKRGVFFKGYRILIDKKWQWKDVETNLYK